MSSRAGLLGSRLSVAILPMLESDPDPTRDPLRWRSHRFERRSQVVIAAPRPRDRGVPVRVIPSDGLPRPVEEHLGDAGVAVPGDWSRARGPRFGGRNRWAEIQVSAGTDPSEVVRFACEAIEALDPERPTGAWLVVASSKGTMPGSQTA